jgi:hypothetical protein
VFETTVPEAPLTDAAYNLWTIHLENVDVGLRELWIQQFRYVGSGRASGAFRLRPARTLWVGPASLELSPGQLTAGGQEISPGLAGHVDCVVHPFDVRKPEGLAVLRFISAGVKLDAPKLSLSAAELFLPREQGTLAAGVGELLVDVRMDRGKLRAASRLELRQRQLVFEHPFVELAVAQVGLVASAGPDGRGEARLELQDGALALHGSSAEQLRLHDVLASVTSSSLDTAEDWTLVDARLLKARIVAPDVRWFNRWLARAGWASSRGVSEISTRFSYKDGELEGDAQASLRDVHAKSSDGKVVIDGGAKLAWSEIRLAERSGVLTGSLTLRRARLEHGTSSLAAGGVQAEGRAQATAGAIEGKLSVGLDDLSAHGDSGFARARRAALSFRIERPGARHDAVATRLTTKLFADQVSFAAGAGSAGLTGQAKQLRLSSRLSARKDGELDASLKSSARELRAVYGRESFVATPELAIEISDLDRKAARGRIHADLVVRDFSARDTSNDGDCPWSRIALAKVRGDIELRGAPDARIRVSSALSKVMVAWGDFMAQAENSDLRLDFDPALLAERRGPVRITGGLRGVRAQSGSAAPLGWAATLPVLDFDAELERAQATFSGPVKLAAKRVAVRIGRTLFDADLAFDASFALIDPARQHAIGKGTARVSGLGLELAGDEVRDWWANVNVDFFELTAKENLDLIGRFRANLRDALPALKVLSSQDELPGWVPAIFPLRELSATGTVGRDCRVTEVSLAGNGGPFESEGRVQGVFDAVRGAFLVRLAALNPLSAGVRFDEKDSGVSLFAGQGWLTKEFATLDAHAKASSGCVSVPRACGN